jgi:hypothetical protein
MTVVFPLARLPSLTAVALVAAALGDPLVESVSNSGLFGRGYHDNNHQSVIPAMVAGGMLVFVILAARCWSIVRSGSPLRRGDWLLESASRFSQPSALPDLPVVLAFQLAALFAMESAEQLFFGGELLGGTVWLGGPIAFSLATHALLGTSCTLLFLALMRSIHEAVASLVRRTIETILVLLARSGARLVVEIRNDAARPHLQAPPARQIGGRAPPPLPFAA